MTTANQKATRTYDIVNGGSREALLAHFQLLGRPEIAKREPFTFEVDNNLRTTKNGRRLIVPGKVKVYVYSIAFLRDINGHCDGDVVEVRGTIVNDSSIPGAKGQFKAVYDTRHRGRKIDRKFRQKVNVIRLEFDNVAFPVESKTCQDAFPVAPSAATLVGAESSVSVIA